jgi:tetratricopeptide (TPR) repeat protein
MGNLYLAKGDLNKAKSQYQKALTLQPRFPQALKNLALVYVENKEYANALSEFHKMIDIWPDNAEIHYNIACMYSRLNRVDESIEWLKKAIDKGYANWKNIKTDSDLENIRNSSAYQELIRNH